MSHISKLAGLALLAACSSDPATLLDKLSAANIYAPVIADGETNIIDAISDESAAGVPGFIGLQDGTVKPVLVRTNADQSILFLSIDGGPAFELPRVSGAGMTNIDFKDEPLDTDGTIGYDQQGSNYVFFADPNNRGQGYYGLETAPSAFPSTAEYDGTFLIRGDNSFSNGDVTFFVDFAGGGLAGVVSGVYERSGDVSIDTVFAGTLSGIIEGSRIAADMTIEGEDVTGQLDMLGAFYGENGPTLSGGVAGTVNDEPMGGRFETTIPR